MESEQYATDVEYGLFRGCDRPCGGFGFGGVIPAVVDEESQPVP